MNTTLFTLSLWFLWLVCWAFVINNFVDASYENRRGKWRLPALIVLAALFDYLLLFFTKQEYLELHSKRLPVPLSVLAVILSIMLEIGIAVTVSVFTWHYEEAQKTKRIAKSKRKVFRDD